MEGDFFSHPRATCESSNLGEKCVSWLLHRCLSMTCGPQYKCSNDYALLAYASEYYDANRYIRNCHQFEDKLKNNA